MEKRFINLTGKLLKVNSSDGKSIVEIEPDNTYAKPYVPVDYKNIDTVTVGSNTVDIAKSVKGEISGLPEPEEGTYFIVSWMVAEKARRADFVVPDKMLKNSVGGIISCRCFTIF